MPVCHHELNHMCDPRHMGFRVGYIIGVTYYWDNIWRMENKMETRVLLGA